MSTTTKANTATNLKSQEGHHYKEMHSKSRRTALPPGAEAPDFTLRSTPDQWLTLSEFQGQPVVLAFYPADWSPVCGDQMALYNEILKVNGTPCFFINGKRYDGSRALESLLAAVSQPATII